MTTTEFRVDREFKELIAPLGADELAKLDASIAAEGCRVALDVWNGLLLDGHNCYEICRRLGKPYCTHNVELTDRLAARIWIRENQLGRRNLTDDQRAMQVAGLVADRTVQSNRDRAKAAGKVGGRHHPKVSSVDAAATKLKPEKKTRIRTKLSKQARVSERKVKQAQVVQKAAPSMAVKVQAGELSLADAVRAVSRRAQKAQLEDVAVKKAKEIEGVYDVLVIDPPWPMKMIERDECPNQSELAYPTMTEDELKAFKVPAAQDAHVWLWTTHRFLPLAFQLLDIWGLSYVCTFVWHKPGGFQPTGLPQYNCEFALYARNGAPKFLDTKRFPVCFSAPRGKHSEKPSAFYAVVRRVTAGRKLDMFNRRKIDGFDGWGKEAP